MRLRIKIGLVSVFGGCCKFDSGFCSAVGLTDRENKLSLVDKNSSGMCYRLVFVSKLKLLWLPLF